MVGHNAVKALAAAGSFAFTGSLNTARYDHTATLLQNGEVLVTGGLGVNGIYDPLASAELYNPTKGKRTVTGSMSEGRFAFTATLLPNGEVLVARGSGYTASCFRRAAILAVDAVGINGSAQILSNASGNVRVALPIQRKNPNVLPETEGKKLCGKVW
jgi:hypothetical protein